MQTQLIVGKGLPILINGVKLTAPEKHYIGFKKRYVSMVHCMVYRTLETNLTTKMTVLLYSA
jgi:hypothetical protein